MGVKLKADRVYWSYLLKKEHLLEYEKAIEGIYKPFTRLIRSTTASAAATAPFI